MGKDICQMSAAEKAKFYKDRKKKKNALKKLKHYQLKAEEYNFKKRSQRTKDLKQTKDAIWKRNQRKQLVHKREKIRQRVQRYRSKNKRNERNNIELQNIENAFPNRMSKSRAIKQLRCNLPETPVKREAVFHAYLTGNSPTPKTVRRQLENSFKNGSMGDKVLDNLREFIAETKSQRSDEARTTMNIVSASISGENIAVSGSSYSLAKTLGVPPKRISGGKRLRTSVLKSDQSCFKYTVRKTRNDALSTENKKLAYDFWSSPKVSRLTGNKNDVKRARIGPKLYTSHPIQILEKTQTEVFLDFKEIHPDIKMSQRAFESCKPYFVLPVRPKDRQTCCCRAHIEMRSLFRSCMDFRRNVLKIKTAQERANCPLFDHLNDAVKATLCDIPEGCRFYQSSCLNRECPNCGPAKMSFLPEEMDTSDEAKNVTWERYEYINIKIKGDKIRRKLQLVKKTTKPSDMFDHFLKLLHSFPSHQFRATWQNDQFRTLLENLPQDHAVCVHDYSENFRCSDQTEVQSSYFQKTEVSIHVSILYRHSSLQQDGKDSNIDEPTIVSEQFFVISPDLQHDRHFTRHCQKLISDYLKSISAGVKVMHEFTDGCSAQYKSRNCMGDVAFSQDLGYDKIIRNFFETAHAKGPQDAAGGFIKKQADLHILRGAVRINNAKDLYDFAISNLTTPKSGIYKRRIFRYVESIPRNVNKNYKAVERNRRIHQVVSKDSRGSLIIRDLSCYECPRCIAGDPRMCKNDFQLGKCKAIHMSLLSTVQDSSLADELEEELFCDDLKGLIAPNQVVAVLADDPDYEYYLLKVTEFPNVLSTRVRDDWGVTFKTGSDVVKGYYYERAKRSPLNFKLVPNKLAVVYSLAVRYICVEIRCSSRIKIPENLHHDILGSIGDF